MDNGARNTPRPGTYNWTQFAGDMGDGLMDRMSREVLLHIGIGSDECLELSESEEQFDYRARFDRQTECIVAAIEDDTGLALTIHEADTGRGASWFGLVIEIVEAVATVGGASATMIGVSAMVKRVYHKFAKTAKCRPLVSLGAAEHLAIANLVDRVVGTPQLIGSGDLCSESPDRAFTGGDAFWVALTADSKLHHYHVSAYGEVFYIGSSPLIRDHWDKPPLYILEDECDFE